MFAYPMSQDEFDLLRELAQKLLDDYEIENTGEYTTSEIEVVKKWRNLS